LINYPKVCDAGVTLMESHQTWNWQLAQNAKSGIRERDNITGALLNIGFNLYARMLHLHGMNKMSA